MSYDIFLVPSSRTPAGAAFEQRLGAALDSHGTSSGSTATFRLRSGGEIDIYADAESIMFASYGGLARGAPSLLWSVADAVEMFIVPADESGHAYRTSSNYGEPPEDFLPIRDVASPDELQALLLG
jgi:hypothetical protein